MMFARCTACRRQNLCKKLTVPRGPGPWQWILLRCKAPSCGVAFEHHMKDPPVTHYRPKERAIMKTSTHLYVIYNALTSLYWDGKEFKERDIDKATVMTGLMVQLVKTAYPYAKAAHAPPGSTVVPAKHTGSEQWATFSDANSNRITHAELPALERRLDTGSNDVYKLLPHAEGVWIEVEGIMVHVYRSREGRTVDVELRSADENDTVFASTLAAQPLRLTGLSLTSESEKGDSSYESKTGQD